MLDVFSESQRDRDTELAKYLNVSIPEVEKCEIASQASIKVYKDEDIKADSFEFIYKDYKYLRNIEYFRTLSALTITRRARYIKDLENNIGSFGGKKILDFGSGVGSHGIYCLQRGATVDFLDVDGPLYKYAKWRVNYRGLKANKYLSTDSVIKENHYDAIICLDVLEHVADPIAVFMKIHNALKPGGCLALEVSVMIKPTSGHFSQAINRWKDKGVKKLANRYRTINRYIYIKR